MLPHTLVKFTCSVEGCCHYAVSNPRRCIRTAARYSRGILQSCLAAFKTTFPSWDACEIGTVRYQMKWVKCNLSYFLSPLHLRALYLQAMRSKLQYFTMYTCCKSHISFFINSHHPIPHSFYVTLWCCPHYVVCCVTFKNVDSIRDPMTACLGYPTSTCCIIPLLILFGRCLVQFSVRIQIG